MRSVILSVALLGLGVAGGYLLGALRGRDTSTVVVREGDARADRPVVVAAGDRGLSEAELRRIVREELAASDHAAGGHDERASAAPAVAAPAAPPSVPGTLDNGMRIVHQAVAARRWTQEDAQALGQTLANATPEESAELMRTLLPALNRGELKLTYRGPFVY